MISNELYDLIMKNTVKSEDGFCSYPNNESIKNVVKSVEDGGSFISLDSSDVRDFFSKPRSFCTFRVQEDFSLPKEIMDFQSSGSVLIIIDNGKELNLNSIETIQKAFPGRDVLLHVANYAFEQENGFKIMVWA